MKDKNTIDITKMSLEELKKIDLNDILVYINELEDTKTVIIYFFNIIKQMSDESNSDYTLAKIRKRFRETNNLEEKLDEIYCLIEQNKLFLDLELDTLKDEIESELGHLKYQKLTEIETLDEKGEEIEYKTELREYNNVKEQIREFFSKISTLYLDTLEKRDDQNRALEDIIKLLKELQATPQMSHGFDMGNPITQQLKELFERANKIKREKNLQKRNKEKANRFYEEQKRLKKERGLSSE
ncbi:MAG: hypothetical protein ACFE8A_13480 [Candidatus Hodarchaeota archaeon]